MLTGMPVKEYPIEKIDYGLLRLCFKREHIVIAHGNDKFRSFIDSQCDTNSVDEKQLLNYWNVGQVVEVESEQGNKEEGEQSLEEDNAVDNSPSKKKSESKNNKLIWVELLNPYCKNKSLKGKRKFHYF